VIRRLAALLAALALVLAPVACGAKQDRTVPAGSQKLSVMLDYFPNADHVGLYQALAGGDFARAGLDVQVRTPSDPAAPLKLLTAGKVDLAISYEPELLLARDKGAPLVAVGAIVQKPLTSIVALGSAHIRTPRDLAGKRVGTAGIPYQSAYLKTILARAHVRPSSVKETSVGFNLVPAMLSKKVDATLGSYWNYEAIQLRLKGKHPSVIRVDRAGVPSYAELVLVARRDYVGRHGSEVRRFVQALGRGYAAVRADPARGVRSLLAEVPDLRSDRTLQAASVRATLPVFFPANHSKPFGWQDPAAWQAYGRWMYRNRLLRRPPAAANALTNEFLAGQGA
jgi:putative hydroxymethylpyrimidine transport system substrate-binding protein